MRRSSKTSLGTLVSLGILSLLAAAGSIPDGCAFDEVIFGKQLLGPTITEDDCRGRVTVFFVWGIT